MKFKSHQEVGALFKLVARKTDSSVARETDWFCNLVLDTGLARMSVGTWIDRCCIGTGNSTPVAAQTALDKFLASTTTKQASSTSVQVTTSPYYYSVTVTWRFGQGVAAGNISEVGLGWGNSNLWNRALIKDSNGNPTTITVLSDEYLDVISEIRIYPGDTVSGSFNLLDKAGALISTHTITGVPALVANNSTFQQITFGWFNVSASDLTTDKTSQIGNGTYFTSSVVTYPTPNSVRSVLTIDLSSANFSHKSIGISISPLGNPNGIGCGYKVGISPAITKTSAQKMTYTFDLTWGRYAA